MKQTTAIAVVFLVWAAMTVSLVALGLKHMEDTRPVVPEDFQSESLGEHLFHEGHDCTVASPINPDASVRVRCDKGVGP